MVCSLFHSSKVHSHTANPGREWNAMILRKGMEGNKPLLSTYNMPPLVMSIYKYSLIWLSQQRYCDYLHFTDETEANRVM